ncbi:hypothetical protein KP509_26G016600 [Ceratopteris richardii]|uniref:Uncharacterized protein n=1 Tax=Ceratopteris richardii TaxID=49495 RepID=A0A8T2RK00_CERRI|nr:hypothetical protein KP509_26G016600 [Ceratopteris richardii]
MKGPVVIRSGEAWEIVNDDGLIYKRRKKEIVDEPEDLPPPIQSHVDVHWRRNRKKAALHQLKSRYLAEIDEWEKLLQKLENPPETKVSAAEAELSASIVSQNSIVDGSEQKFTNMVENLSYQVFYLLHDWFKSYSL